MKQSQAIARHARPVLLGVGGMLLCLLADDPSVAAQPVRACKQSPASVANATPLEMRLICRAVRNAIEVLSRCGIDHQGRQRIEVVEQPPQPCGMQAFAAFESRHSTIKVVHYRMCRRMAEAGSAYAAVPSRTMYRSIVAHEVAHAVVAEQLGARAIPRAAHEYIAYVVGLESMPHRNRERFLDTFGKIARVNLDVLSDLLLTIAPQNFGAIAYAHFRQPGNGCHALRGAMSGTLKFPISDE